MAKTILTNALIKVNSVDLSDHCSSILLEDKADQIETTSFSASNYKEYALGMKDATVTATFFSDFASSSVHSVLQPLYASGGTFSVEIRPDGGNVSPTNPSAKMTARLYSYTGISGKVGDAATFDAAFQNAGTAGLVWGTA